MAATCFQDQKTCRLWLKTVGVLATPLESTECRGKAAFLSRPLFSKKLAWAAPSRPTVCTCARRAAPQRRVSGRVERASGPASTRGAVRRQRRRPRGRGRGPRGRPGAPAPAHRRAAGRMPATQSQLTHHRRQRARRAVRPLERKVLLQQERPRPQQQPRAAAVRRQTGRSRPPRAAAAGAQGARASPEPRRNPPQQRRA